MNFENSGLCNNFFLNRLVFVPADYIFLRIFAFRFLLQSKNVKVLSFIICDVNHCFSGNLTLGGPVQFAGSFEFLSYGSIITQVTQYPCVSHIVFWVTFSADTAVSFISYIRRCADGEPQILFFSVYHELLLNFVQSYYWYTINELF